MGEALYAKPARLTTRMLTLGGGAREVDVFLGPALHRHHETETLGERLNTQGLHFLPVASGEKVELLHLDYIADVQFEGGLSELERLGGVGTTHETVTVHLTTGDMLRGDLVYDMPRERLRVSDALNNPRNQFFLLVEREPGRCHYVNRKAVVRVEA